jgi:hypothetical protein
VWHHDGHHKLIRYGLVTHGCVDVYSRTIIYLGIQLVNNALSELFTIMTSFILLQVLEITTEVLRLQICSRELSTSICYLRGFEVIKVEKTF